MGGLDWTEYGPRMGDKAWAGRERQAAGRGRSLSGPRAVSVLCLHFEADSRLGLCVFAVKTCWTLSGLTLDLDKVWTNARFL